MVKKTTAILLLLSFTGMLFSFSFPHISYHTNFNYFAETVCINKHNPELECNGSCQLKRMVEHHQDQDTDDSKSTIHGKNQRILSLYLPEPAIEPPRQYFKIEKPPVWGDKVESQFISEPGTPPPVSLI